MIRIFLVREILKSGGGGCTMFLWLAKQLQKTYDVTLVLFYEDMVDKDLLGDIKTIYITKRHPNKIINRAKFVSADFLFLYSIIKNGKPDVIISFGNSNYWELVILKKFLNFKLIVSERRDPLSNRTLEDRFIYHCYKYADTVVFQSNGAKDIFKQKLNNKLVVIPNPVSVPQQQWICPSEMNSIVNVARMELVQKRQDILFDALAIVLAKVPYVSLHLYGDGMDMQRIKDIAKEKGVLDNVIFHGNVRNIKEKLLNHSVFVFSSDYEGVPNALLEAMSLGMPVVSTDCSPGGAAMLIENGVNGYLVPRGDSRAIANSIIEIITNNKKAVEIGINARISCNRYTEEKMAALWSEAIDSLFIY